MLDDQFTLGVEEEYQIVDPETRELKSYISRLLEDGKSVLRERIRTEMHQSVVEVGTTICKDIGDVRRELVEMRGELNRLAQKGGLRIVAASTHPFSDWKQQEITDHHRYHNIVHDLQDVARANLIFWLHVHVGIEDRETTIHLMNQARYFLPHLLALSANSPFWLGMKTGLKSYRCKVFDKFPRTNIPDTYSSWSDFENFVNLLIKTNCIDNAKKIWWDIRPHPFFSTLEFRVCDIPMRLDETIALAALIQATIAKLYKLHSRNQGFRMYARSLIMENKWRAARYGLDGKLIDFGKETEVPERELIYEYLEFVDDVVDELESRDEINYIHHLLEMGNGAERQLRVFEQTGDFKKVVDYMVEETKVGVFDSEAAGVTR